MGMNLRQRDSSMAIAIPEIGQKVQELSKAKGIIGALKIYLENFYVKMNSLELVGWQKK